MMRMKTTLKVITLALLTFIVSSACKSARLGPTYPIEDFSEYDLVVIATVDRALHSADGDGSIRRFELTIEKCLKGDLTSGGKIAGMAKEEEANAVCPVRLEEKEEYLLLLTSSVDGYRLSRFSFPVKKGYTYFDDYIAQVEKSLSSALKN
jgi:hypothetical protein